MGKTILANNFFKKLGGKGANQAVAAARLEGEVSFYGSLGMDENVQFIQEQLIKENINISLLNYVNDSQTGVAFIELCKSDNRISVVSGANLETNLTYIKNVEKSILEHDVFVFQLETPIEIIDYLVPILHKNGKVIVVNPAPAIKLTKNLLDMITYIIPNEHEYKIVLDEDQIKLEDLLRLYPNKLIVTLGKNGTIYFDGEQQINVPVIKVEAIDTTGAGDTFTGAFSVAISKGKTVNESISFANIAAGISVTKKGAQDGMPYNIDIEAWLSV
ncbi:ribokinase [Rossellomorea sp. GAMAL-10_SWC]